MMSLSLREETVWFQWSASLLGQIEELKRTGVYSGY
jgi:hypothetical protein